MLSSVKNIPKENNNVIQLAVVDGKLGVKPKIRYNKDGSVDKRHPNKVSGVSSEVYPFSKGEIKSMINVLNKHIDESTNDNQRQIACRNKMLFLVGINLSLRISDLISLKWNFFLKDDLTFRDYYKIQPKKTKKTGKFVSLYFNYVVKKAITEYIEQYPIESMDDFVFKSRKGDKPVSERGVWKIIVDTSAEAGIEHNVGTHSLRKTFGYHVWHNAEDKEKALVMLMAIFNHSSVSTTKKYIGIMDEEIEDVFNGLNLGIDFV
ncbi:MAG: tyrosine-type recombinase/integrase [bacterium]|nr:tyrosine-type recombinase/integrase [bacterium]